MGSTAGEETVSIDNGLGAAPPVTVLKVIKKPKGIFLNCWVGGQVIVELR